MYHYGSSAAIVCICTAFGVFVKAEGDYPWAIKEATAYINKMIEPYWTILNLWMIECQIWLIWLNPSSWVGTHIMNQQAVWLRFVPICLDLESYVKHWNRLGTSLVNTVAGRNPANQLRLVVEIPLFTGFCTSQVVQDFWAINCMGTWLDMKSFNGIKHLWHPMVSKMAQESALPVIQIGWWLLYLLGLLPTASMTRIFSECLLDFLRWSPWRFSPNAMPQHAMCFLFFPVDAAFVRISIQVPWNVARSSSRKYVSTCPTLNGKLILIRSLQLQLENLKKHRCLEYMGIVLPNCMGIVMKKGI